MPHSIMDNPELLNSIQGSVDPLEGHIDSLDPTEHSQEKSVGLGFLAGRLKALRKRNGELTPPDTEGWANQEKRLLKLQGEARNNSHVSKDFLENIDNLLKTARKMSGRTEEGQQDPRVKASGPSFAEPDIRDEGDEERARNLAAGKQVERKLAENDAKRRRAESLESARENNSDGFNNEDQAEDLIGDVSDQFVRSTDPAKSTDTISPILVRGEPITPNLMERTRQAVASHHLGDRAVDAVKDIPPTLKQDFKDNFELAKQDAAVIRHNVGENAAQMKEDLKSVAAAPGAALDAFNSTVLANQLNESFPRHETIFTQKHADALKAAPTKVGPALNAARKGISEAVAADVGTSKRILKEFMYEGLQGPPEGKRLGPEIPDALKPPAKSIGATLKQDFRDNFQVMRQDLTRARRVGNTMLDKSGKAFNAMQSTVLMNSMNDAFPKSEDIFTKKTAKKVGKAAISPIRKLRGRSAPEETESEMSKRIREAVAEGRVWGAPEPSSPASEEAKVDPPSGAATGETDAGGPAAGERAGEAKEGADPGETAGGADSAGGEKKVEAAGAGESADKKAEEAPEMTQEEKRRQRLRSFWQEIGLNPDFIETRFEQAQDGALSAKQKEEQVGLILSEINKTYLEYMQRQREGGQSKPESATSPAENGGAAEQAASKPVNGEDVKNTERLEIERKLQMEEIFAYAVQVQTLVQQLPDEISLDSIAYRPLKKANKDIQTFIVNERKRLTERNSTEEYIRREILLSLKELWINLVNDIQRVRPGWAGHIELQKELEERLKGNHVPRMGQSEIGINEHPEQIEARFARAKLLPEAIANYTPAEAAEVQKIMAEVNKSDVLGVAAMKMIDKFNLGKEESDKLAPGKHPNEPVTNVTLVKTEKNPNIFVQIVRNRLGETFIHPIIKEEEMNRRIRPKDELVNVDESYIGRKVQAFDMKYLAGPAMGFGRDVSVFVTTDSGAIMRLSQQGNSGRIYIEDAAHPGHGTFVRSRPKEGAEDQFDPGRLELGKAAELLTDSGAIATGRINEIVIVYTNSHDLLPKAAKKKKNEVSGEQPQLQKSDVLSRYNSRVHAAQERDNQPARRPAAWNQPSRTRGRWSSQPLPQAA